MFKLFQIFTAAVMLTTALAASPTFADEDQCKDQLGKSQITAIRGQAHSRFISPVIQWISQKAVNLALDAIGAYKGLPKYLERNTELQQTGRYLNYDNFGEMGLAEMGISVQFNQAKLDALNTDRPMIIVANHHLGIADGLSLQHLASTARRNQPSLLFLARWIEKLLPNAIYGDEHGWGTAVPVEINKPNESDPDFDEKMAELKAFNSGWSRKAAKALKQNGLLVIFPAGQVASIDKDSQHEYPNSVYDAEGSWQEAVINLARLGKADIVFAHVDSVNSEDFYLKRKRFGGGDKERVIWFFSEALAKSGTAVDVFLSDPVSIHDLHSTLARQFVTLDEQTEDQDQAIEELTAQLKGDQQRTAKLMRLYTYLVQDLYPQELDAIESPERQP
ncbi:MAG: hypothetical protein HRT45_08100 [Bdellovibrionales bacterium]|nr:hypothetical protein [Bdellovibrionales bacterium]